MPDPAQTSAIPTLHAKFAQVAVQQRFISSEQVRSAVEIYRRYEAAGGEVPSLSRILVARQLVSMRRAEALMRHLVLGEPLPSPQQLGVIAPPQSAALDDLDVIEADLDLEPPGSGINLPVEAHASAMDERQALIEGLGATVMRKELKNITGYKITQVIGEGSMGIVYKAHQISMDRTVALKVLPAERTKDRRFVDEFLAEARNAGRLNHPNLIRVHEVGEREGTYYYSMEYVEGQRLDEWMDECEGGHLPVKDALNVFAQAAAALDYGFRCGVIHREIRPNTIMVGDDGQAKLADLGLTKGEHTRFLDGENAYYVAPEQIKTREVDTRADIYSLGCCLFHCLTGEPPFEGGGPRDVLQRRLGAPAPNVQDLNPDVPAELAGIVGRMMAREPRDRYQTPAEVADALKKVNFAPSTRSVKPLAAKPARHPRPGLRRHGQRPTSGRLGAKSRYGHKRRHR